MADRLIAPNERALARAIGGRLLEALSLYRVSVVQLARKIGQPKQLVERWAFADVVPAAPAHFVDVAEALGIDARWLATGAISETAQKRIKAAKKFDARARFAPQVHGDLWVCRYCGCDELHACLDALLQPCVWVDDQSTICSTCLVPRA